MALVIGPYMSGSQKMNRNDWLSKTMDSSVHEWVASRCYHWSRLSLVTIDVGFYLIIAAITNRCDWIRIAMGNNHWLKKTIDGDGYEWEAAYGFIGQERHSRHVIYVYS